jgi:hypothetical protein
MREGARCPYKDFAATLLGFGYVAYAMSAHTDRPSLSGNNQFTFRLSRRHASPALDYEYLF